MKSQKLLCIIAMVLTVATLLSACAGGSETKSTSDSADKGGGTEVSSAPKAGESEKLDPSKVTRKDPFEKFDPTIELTTVRAELVVVKFEDGDNMDNNVWYRTYEEELGIKVKNLWVVDSSQLTQKTDLMIASGDLADVFQVNDIQFQQLIDNDLLEDISQAYLEYISDDAKAILTEGGPYALDAAIRGGKLMGIPFTGNQLEGISLYWIRTDWLEALNLSIPKTQQELEEVLIAFATKDPDKNGKADTYSILLTKDSFKQSSHADALFYSYKAYPNTWYDDGSGNLVWGGIQPEAKEALAAYKRLYDAGAINPEFTTIDYSKALEAVIADKVGMIYEGYYGSGGVLQPHVEATKKTDIWQAYPLPSIDGKPVKLHHDTAPYGFHVVRKGYKYPEAAIKMLNMWIQEFYINTTDWDRYLKLVQNETGTNPKWNLSLCQAYRPLNNINNFRNLERWIETGNKEYYDKVTFLGKSFYEGGIRFKEKGEISQWFWWVMHCPEYENPAMRITSKNIADKNLQPNLFYGAPTPTMTEKWKLLCEKQAEVYQSIISGGSLDEFDKFVEEWKALGGEQITKEVNAWYQEHKNAADNVFVK